MNIIVDGRSAVLKEGASFDYISENRLFNSRDGYTLNISFPLKDCPQNRDIFGHINRLDVAKENLQFECSIVDSRISLFGTLFVTKVSEVEIECQFAEGRCAQTVTDPFDEVSIVDLDLGSAPSSAYSDITPAQAWKSIDAGASEVALPWINEGSPTVPNNWVKYASGSYSWESENDAMSWQPYLIVIAKRICDAIGYDYDFSEWEDSPMRHLIICNTLPGAWEMPQYAKVLPDWTVSEFFARLELLMMCEFDFDHKAASVRMRFSKSAIAEIDPVKIDELVDSYNVDLSRDDNVQCEYLASKRLAYKSCSHSMWCYYSCDWYVKSSKRIIEYETLAELIEKNKRKVDHAADYSHVLWGEPVPEDESRRTVHELLYAADVDTYFVFRAIGYEYIGQDKYGVHYQLRYVLQPVNVFGSGSVEDDSTATEEIEFVPVCIMDTYVRKAHNKGFDDRGFMMFLSPAAYNESDSDDLVIEDEESADESSDPLASYNQPGPASKIAEGETEKNPSYYDEIYVAFWDGSIPVAGKTPYPIIDGLSMVSQDWVSLSRPGLSMRIAGNQTDTLQSELPQIDPTQKFKFSWIDSTIPNPRAIFNIRGKRYLCEKITATFTESGMSQLLKGEFYPLLED